MATIELMFKDIENNKLRHYFVDALAKVVRAISMTCSETWILSQLLTGYT